MTWKLNPDPVCGGISIIDENGRGVAIVIQRDPHPTLGQGVTLEEADRRARVMAASEDLLDALEACLDYGSMTGEDWVSDKARSAVDAARAIADT